jgi:hypothetical protein
MASHTQQYHNPYMAQTQQVNHFHSAQPHQHTFAQNYTAQPIQHEPWNGHAPSRSAMTPRTGGVMFDAMTDPVHVNYGDYLNHNDVESWTLNFTDPNYLVSPSEQRAPPQENFFNIAPQHVAPQTLVHRPQLSIPSAHMQSHVQPQVYNSSPMETPWTRTSPQPDEQNFINYDANSALFTDNYITDAPHPPSSPGNSSMSHYPRSPYQPIVSPPAASPGSSDGVFSYQSDSGMMIDPFPVNQFDQMPAPSNVAVQGNFMHANQTSGMTFEVIPAPETAASAAALKNLKNGGRALGTHLEPDVAKAAHDMRKISACWHCVLQRDKCGPGDICERCLKRSQRPNADCGLGCIRIKLVELSPYFLPGLITQMHEDAHLKHFVNQYVHGWGNVELTLYMTCGGNSMPRIPVKVYEFVPKGSELLVQIQYITDPRTNMRIAVKKQSPALGMVHINHNEEKTYDRYISEIVDNHLDAFGELCWAEDDNDFLPKLFKLMTRVKPKNEDEVDFPPPHRSLTHPGQTSPRSPPPHRRNLYNVAHPHHCRGIETRDATPHALVRRPLCVP